MRSSMFYILCGCAQGTEETKPPKLSATDLAHYDYVNGTSKVSPELPWRIKLRSLTPEFMN